MKRNTCICLGAELALLFALSFCNSGISIFVRTDAPADTEVKFEYKTIFGSFSKTGKTNADRQAFFQISYAPRICGFRVSVTGQGAPKNIYFFGKTDGEIAVENNVWNDHKIKGKTRGNYVIMIFCITSCAYMVMKYKSSQRSREALSNSGKIEYLDIVRITALFLILYAHLSSVACFAPTIPDIFSSSCRLPVLDASKTKLYTVDTHFNHFQTAAGQIGVVLFLLISAYLTNISRAKYDNREFLKRRVIRLWPGLIVALTAVALLVHYLGGVEISVWQYVSNLFLLNPFLGYAPIEGVVWVLVIEVLFYLIMALAKPFNFKKALAIDAFCAFVLFFQINSGNSSVNALNYYLRFIPLMVFGCAMREYGVANIRPALKLFTLGILAYLILYISIKYIYTFDVNYASEYTYLFALAIWAVAYMLNRMIRAKPGKILGGAKKIIVQTSYMVYLLHVPVGLLTMYYLRDFLSPLPNFIAALVSVYTASALLYYFAEKPLTRFLTKRFL